MDRKKFTPAEVTYFEIRDVTNNEYNNVLYYFFHIPIFFAFKKAEFLR
jgi:hypothetical protein